MNQIITIGREFGSGGRELGRRLAELRNVAYYDQEIIRELSKRTALSEEYIRQIEESRPIRPFPIHVGQSFFQTPNPVLQQSVSVFSEQHRLLCELAEKSDCVIVGRCADYLLRAKKPFRIFVYADAESRLRRCMERRPADEMLSEREMRRKMEEIDRGRAQYYGFFSEHKWGARENYDLMVNTTGAEPGRLAEAVCAYLDTVLP